MDKYKNIVVSTHDLISPIMGGGGLRTLKVAREFKERGHNVVIVSPADRISELNGMRVYWLHPPRKQRSQILSSLKFNVRLFLRFIRIAGATEVFFIHNTIAAATLPFLKKFYDFRFILDITDIHAEYLLIGKRNIFERVLTPFLLRYEYFIINSADFVIVATKAMKELLISKGIDSSKIDVVYDGVAKEQIPRAKEEKAEYGVIHLGAVDRQHGVDTLIRAIPRVINEVPESRFYFIGGGRELHNIKELARELGVADRCVFSGPLSFESAKEFLKKASIGIIPRGDYLPNRIITTLKIFEYWGSGTAVVAPPLRGIKEISSDGDILWFKSADAGDLAEKITFLMKNAGFREGLAQAGFITADRFDLAESASRIAALALKEP